LQVDAEKMSKSKGNFLMLLECVEEFTADATRFALADAGDTLEDANFDRAVANQAITYLYNEEEWIRQVLAEAEKGTLRQGEWLCGPVCFVPVGLVLAPVVEVKSDLCAALCNSALGSLSICISVNDACATLTFCIILL
jgi:cysteinyl-tRNA synthetase